MQKGKTIVTVAGTLALIGGLTLAGASAANAINTVACGSRTDFLKVQSTCFANAGTTDTTVFNVGSISSGVNDGYIYTDQNLIEFPANWGISLASLQTAQREHIN